MPDIGVLDSLVKLASLGASGICIFAIFWIGWLISRLPEKSDPQRHKTLRLFMGTCVLIAIIAAATGIANAMFNAEAIGKLETEKTALTTRLADTEAERVAADKRLAEAAAANKAIARSLEIVLNAKEAEALRTNAPPEIQNNIRILKDSVRDLQELIGP
jgi:formate hydrogenlyase subunit 3/multisubunit Na+/H+ antiporter MnhD subunit